MLRAVIAIVAGMGTLAAQIDAGTELWVHVRQHARASVAGLPNYTCQETMERSIRAPSGPIEFRERLRLEVLVAERTELFAWPGSQAFTPEPLENWIRAGALGTGAFAAELHNLFVSSNATVKYAGTVNRDGRALHRFDFYAALLSSKHEISVDGKSAITAYSGVVWVDPDSLDVVRMESRAEDIPADLDCTEASESVTYGRIRLGAIDRLIPSATDLTIVRRDGRESRSAVTFSRCAHYGATSSVSFSTDVEHSPSQAHVPEAQLPPEVTLVLQLEQPILLDEAAAGDPISARLDKAMRSGALKLPKGTRALGRIRRLEQHLNKPASILVGLQFFQLEAPGGLIRFSARLTGPRATPIVIRAPAFEGQVPDILSGGEGLNIEDDGSNTGVGSFRVSGKHKRLERFRTIWKTQ